jgi:phospholipid transport system substrate-binding protein
MVSRSILRTLLPLLCLALARLTGPARAGDDAAGFVGDLGSRAIGVLTSRLSDADRERQFRILFDAGFDVPAISRFVLGPYWKTASDAQRQEFATLFEAYIVHVYSVRFSAYADQLLTVQGSRPDGDHAEVVRSQIALPNGGAAVNVEWHVAQTDKGFSVTDFVVEGVSMALTERQEFGSVIQRGGGQLEGLLKQLRAKTTARNG